MVVYAAGGARGLSGAATASPEQSCTAGNQVPEQLVSATLACRSAGMRSPVISNYLYEPALAQLLSVMLLRATRNNLRQRAS